MINTFGKDTPESVPGIHDPDMLLANINTWLDRGFTGCHNL